MKNGDIRLRDIKDNYDFAQKFDFNESVLSFLEAIFNASKSDPARETASQVDLERLFRPCDYFPEEFDLDNAISPVASNSTGR